MTSFILGIDTSCDETSVAILAEDLVASNIISSQIKMHAAYGGVVPELASRAHVENLPIVVGQALAKANCGFKDLTGIAVTTSPGLIGCLLVGLSYAKALAYSLKIPITCVHHLKGHLFSPFIGAPPSYPFLGLVVSGGHTALYRVLGFNQIDCLGQTVDDAAGEAYDKTAKLLGLGYPGGPILDQFAQSGNEKAHSFTRARVKKGRYYFSFSGLKTAVSLVVKKWGLEKSGDREEFIKNLAASFQAEVVGTLVEKVHWAREEYGIKTIAVSGGVACNSRLRKELGALGAIIPPPMMCTDNGAMIAYVGEKQLQQGKFSGLDSNAHSSAPMW